MADLVTNSSDNDTEEDPLVAPAPGTDTTDDLSEQGKPWRDENGILTYELFGDFEKDRNNVGRPPPGGQLVRIVDGAPIYANKNFFWVVFTPAEPLGETTFKSLAAYNRQRIEAGSEPFVPPGAVQVDELQGVPIFQADPSSSNTKPGTNTGSTTSRTNGVTTTTTTSQTNTNTTTTESSVYDDAILRQARTAPARTNTTGGGATSNRVSPTTVTGAQAQAGPAATRSTGNAYVYEPIRPGFDRYDFNLGKKVFTPDTGTSLQTYAGSNEPTTQPRLAEANRNSAANNNGFGTDPQGEFGGTTTGSSTAYSAQEAQNVEDLRSFNADLGGGAASANLTPGERAYAREKGYIR